MRELPLLACDSVALNLRSGRQTQHRVPMRPQPFHLPGGWYWHRRTPGGKDRTKFNIHECHWRERPHEWAPWQPGDSLYVRECWSPGPKDGDWWYRAGGGWQPRYGAWERDHSEEMHVIQRVERWRPSIHMPKKAARTWLKVKRGWVERVQDINEPDARAEGAMSVMDHLSKFELLYPGCRERNDWLWCCELELDRERSGVTHG